MTEQRGSEWAEFFNGHAPEYEENCFTNNTVAEIEIMVLGKEPAQRSRQ